jgi:hypothetical protein
MRLPMALRDAAALAVAEFGAAPSTTSTRPPSQRSARSRSTLAAQDGSPLADRPDLIARAAEAVVARRADADADDVLLWAEAQLAVVT